MTGVPLWVKVILAFWLAFMAGCVVAELFPATAQAQGGATAQPGADTLAERRHQELVAAVSSRPESGDKTTTIVLLVGMLQVLQSLGIIGWARWSVGQIAKGEADRVAAAGRDGIKAHNDDQYAHVAAAEHNHAGIIAKIDEVEADVKAVAKSVRRVNFGLSRLISEHGVFHGGRQVRATDPPGFTPPGLDLGGDLDPDDGEPG